jgi:Holliday junction resolvasome RuvABC endonuclease subunit
MIVLGIDPGLANTGYGVVDGGHAILTVGGR